MALSNSDRIGKALDHLKVGLVHFVEREMKAVHKENWQQVARQYLHNGKSWLVRKGQVQWDAHLLLSVLWNHWNEVFKQTLGIAERSLVSELKEVRNKWAHQKAFSTDDAYRALDSMARLLTAVSADEAQAVEEMKQELLRVRFEKQARRQLKSSASISIESKPRAGLKPWREIVTPHPDVAQGRYQQAEFAADLAQVHRNEGASEYRDPREFFQRTFLTDGLRQLLKEALLRLSGSGGNPVVELQTNFGGGKTHSMLALFHLFSGVAPQEMEGIEDLIQEIQIEDLPKAQRAVLVGTALSPAHTYTKPDGSTIHTLWGELAWQLGGKEGYALVAESDRAGISPGSQELREIFTRFGPCLVLIDEWVTYVRQLYRIHNLPAGSFDANFTFAQVLTEAAKHVSGTLVVASIPASDIETGGEGGKEAQNRFKNIFSRLESPWRPASAEESFEIVRRRLFQPLVEPHHFAERDAVIKAFSQMYRDQSQEFPAATGEGEYERRMKAAYPIHPELFDRLYEDWSILEQFQRTRGVLRLMAAVIHELWERNDNSLLILPSCMPIDASSVHFELTRYLENNWVPVIEKDVDGPNSTPLIIDRENPNLGRYSACRRVARTVYMGSAPTAGTKQPGLDDRRIKLGCAQPGEAVATFGDAIRRLTDRATHLYVDGTRYWFSTQPSVTRLAQDRAAQQDIHELWNDLKRRLQAEARQRGEFAGVHVAPEDDGKISDETHTRLVILGPESPHSRRIEDSPARLQAEKILNHRGTSPRMYRNALMFLAPDNARLGDLEQALRQFRAWDSIDRDKESLNLDSFQRNQAATKKKECDEAVHARIFETFVWLLVPVQTKPNSAVEWQEIRTTGNSTLAARASRKLINDEHLIATFSATRLRMALDQYLWKDVDHISLKKLWDYFASYLYLPRLKDSNTLLEAVQLGIGSSDWKEWFAYAESWDENKQRYVGLRAGAESSVVIDSHSLLVKPEITSKQLQAEKKSAPEEGSPQNGISEQPTEEAESKKPRRFHGTVQLDPIRIGRDAGRIAEEVIQHLTNLNDSQLRVTMEIHAELPAGADESVMRTVTENCQALKFCTFGFEDE